MESSSISKPLNPSAKSWQPEALPVPKIPSDISAFSPQRKCQQDIHPMVIYRYSYYFQSIPFYSVFPLPTVFCPHPLNLDIGSKDLPQEDSSLVEGERALKKSLKIDLDEKKRYRRCLPPRLRWRWGESKKPGFWRAKNEESHGGVVSSGSATSPHVGSNTTVMIKNIPNLFRRKSLMEFLDNYCREHRLEYDFFYLPMDFRSKSNLGFAFVNFTSAAAALKIEAVLHNYEWGVIITPRGKFTSKKVCEITWARIQGKDALKGHFERSIFVCNNREYLPVLLDPPRNGSNTFKSKITTVGKMQGQFQPPRVLIRV